MASGFVKHITDSIGKLLSEVLSSPDNSYFFRKSPRVLVGTPFSLSSPDFHLYFIGHELLERDSGTFRCEESNGKVAVYKNPDRIQLDYLLQASHASLLSRLDAWDRLLAHFFDHPQMEPFVPQPFEKLGGLYDRLIQEKATLFLRSIESNSTENFSKDSVQWLLKYRGPYHSGSVVGTESLVRQRVIEYRNGERSLP